jgi:hypothetical protein
LRVALVSMPFVAHFRYHDDAQARALCETFNADLRAACLQKAGEYYEDFVEPD